jgi:hypothetical protein
MILIDDPKYYVSLLYSGSIHCHEILKYMRGFSKLKKGDYFDFAHDKNESYGFGRIYVATSDYYITPNTKQGRIQAEETYNPEI